MALMRSVKFVLVCNENADNANLALSCCIWGTWYKVHPTLGS